MSKGIETVSNDFNKLAFYVVNLGRKFTAPIHPHEIKEHFKHSLIHVNLSKRRKQLKQVSTRTVFTWHLCLRSDALGLQLYIYTCTSY